MASCPASAKDLNKKCHYSFLQITPCFPIFSAEGAMKIWGYTSSGASTEHTKSDYCTLEGVSAATQTRREAGF